MRCAPPLLVRAAMAEAEVGPATVVAVATAPRAEWPIAVCAAQSLGAAVLPVAVDADLASIRSLHDTHRCTLWVVEDEEQHDKVLEAASEDVALLVLDPRGVSLGDSVRAWADVVDSHVADVAEGPLREAVAALDPDAPAAFVHTSPTATGAAVEIWTHRRFSATAGDGDAHRRPWRRGRRRRRVPVLPAHRLAGRTARGALRRGGDRRGGQLRRAHRWGARRPARGAAHRHPGAGRAVGRHGPRRAGAHRRCESVGSACVDRLVRRAVRACS